MDAQHAPKFNITLRRVVSVAQLLARWAHNDNIVGSNHGLSTCVCRDTNLGQVVNTNVPLSTQVYKLVPGR